MPNNKEKVCIIVAGPAGLSCAMYLEKKDIQTTKSTKS